MTWDEFVELCRQMLEDGVMEDIETLTLTEKPQYCQNAVRDRLEQTGKTLAATAQAVFGLVGTRLGTAQDTNDFVYFHGSETIRVAALGHGGGGHPCLAGMNDPSCAGRILDDGFFFHSGHFQPSLGDGLAFFCQFIRNSCQTLHGAARDNMVNMLAGLKLEYYEGYGGKVFSTTLKRVALMVAEEQQSRSAQPQPSSRHFPTSSAITIGGSGLGSAPYGSKAKPKLVTPTQPMPISSIASTSTTSTTGPSHIVSTSALPLVETSRPSSSPVADFYETARSDKRSAWMPDSTRTSCTICRTAFTFSNRKHHCRKCGNLVCDKCSKARQIVKFPAVEKSSEAVDVSSGPVRVCDNCKGLKFV